MEVRQIGGGTSENSWSLAIKTRDVTWLPAHDFVCKWAPRCCVVVCGVVFFCWHRSALGMLGSLIGRSWAHGSRGIRRSVCIAVLRSSSLAPVDMCFACTASVSYIVNDGRRKSIEEFLITFAGDFIRTGAYFVSQTPVYILTCRLWVKF